MFARQLLLFSSFGLTLLSATPRGPFAGSLACARCHSNIAEAFSRTPMAQTSGRIGTAMSRLTSGTVSLFHSNSGYKFVVEVAPERRVAAFTISYSRGRSFVAGSIVPPLFFGSRPVGPRFFFFHNPYFFLNPLSLSPTNQPP